MKIIHKNELAIVFGASCYCSCKEYWIEVDEVDIRDFTFITFGPHRIGIKGSKNECQSACAIEGKPQIWHMAYCKEIAAPIKPSVDIPKPRRYSY